MMSRQYLLALLIFLLAFVPMAVPHRAIHSDEASHWVRRVDEFWTGVNTGDFARTVQTEHPGVTIMGLAGVGRWLMPDSDIPYGRQVQVLRAPIIFVNALVIALAYLVMVRLFAPGVAFGAALLWATEPYWRWYARLLHIDGLTTTFMMLSFLLALLALRVTDTQPRVNWWVLVLAGVAGGLATLTRFTSMYVVGVVGLMVLANALYHRRHLSVDYFLRQMALPVIMFVGVLVLTWTALYPAMWTSAGRQAIYEETLHGFENASDVHSLGNYFMGQPVDDPGPAFYPVALAYRLSPWVLVGLALALLAAPTMRGQWRVWLLVALYAAVYLGLLTSQGKKLDRYALPIVPTLHLLAAYGWVMGFRFIRVRLPGGRAEARPYNVAWGVVTFAVLVNSFWVYPNDYAYLNPLTRGADETILISGGEGLEHAARHLERSDPALCDKLVAAFYTDTVDGLTSCGQEMKITNLGLQQFYDMDYVLNDIGYRQRYPQVQWLYEGVTPVYTVKLNGVDYVRVYRGDDLNRR